MCRKIYIILMLIPGFFTGGLKGQDQVTTKADSARIITSDIDHFWRAFDLLQTQHTTADSLKAIETIFVRHASEGLRQYMKAANCYATSYLDAIRKRKTDYLKIRDSTETLAGKKKLIVQYLRKFKYLYPSLKIPVICLTIGKFEVGGSQFGNTLYIGSEVDLLRNVDITAQTIHELAHFQQKDQNPMTNLDLAMIEGGAEFVCYQVTGKRTLSSTWAYGLTHERFLWNEFQPKMDSAIDMKWFQDVTDPATGRPGSLGYFIGFKICESYLQDHRKKKTALIELIEMDNPKKIYLSSLYNSNKN